MAGGKCGLLLRVIARSKRTITELRNLPLVRLRFVSLIIYTGKGKQPGSFLIHGGEWFFETRKPFCFFFKPSVSENLEERFISKVLIDLSLFSHVGSID
ncbi:hypothetical protein LOK49_LG10G00424 [Camellia lanceoleosa]|uniref:Uncharacterized protein n=1 Tax=Camellia lanceoleosa TaxID=1840588 RepID=A0ACC0GDR2_9ERIC|nr:hypothetical protein LOK49_LG10G00424 [Camellia lanceoleosa]